VGTLNLKPLLRLTYSKSTIMLKKKKKEALDRQGKKIL
jgi:hypothetical protein